MAPTSTFLSCQRVEPGTEVTYERQHRPGAHTLLPYHRLDVWTPGLPDFIKEDTQDPAAFEFQINNEHFLACVLHAIFETYRQ